MDRSYRDGPTGGKGDEQWKHSDQQLYRVHGNTVEWRIGHFECGPVQPGTTWTAKAAIDCQNATNTRPSLADSLMVHASFTDDYGSG